MDEQNIGICFNDERDGVDLADALNDARDDGSNQAQSHASNNASNHVSNNASNNMLNHASNHAPNNVIMTPEAEEDKGIIRDEERATVSVEEEETNWTRT